MRLYPQFGEHDGQLCVVDHIEYSSEPAHGLLYYPTGQRIHENRDLLAAELIEDDIGRYRFRRPDGAAWVVFALLGGPQARAVHRVEMTSAEWAAHMEDARRAS